MSRPVGGHPLRGGLDRGPKTGGVGGASGAGVGGGADGGAVNQPFFFSRSWRLMRTSLVSAAFSMAALAWASKSCSREGCHFFKPPRSAAEDIRHIAADPANVLGDEVVVTQVGVGDPEAKDGIGQESSSGFQTENCLALHGGPKPAASADGLGTQPNPGLPAPHFYSPRMSKERKTVKVTRPGSGFCRFRRSKTSVSAGVNTVTRMCFQRPVFCGLPPRFLVTPQPGQVS